jgi:hypothetical protein
MSALPLFFTFFFHFSLPAESVVMPGYLFFKRHVPVESCLSGLLCAPACVFIVVLPFITLVLALVLFQVAFVTFVGGVVQTRIVEVSLVSIVTVDLGGVPAGGTVRPWTGSRAHRCWTYECQSYEHYLSKL